MAGIKIVDLPPLGRDLASTDLLELSLAGGTGSRKITGQEIMNTSKLNIGTTAIASGTVGRVLFEGTGNVVQESANLFWDNTNGRLGIGTSSPSTTFAIGSGGINRVNLGLQAFEMYTPSSVRTVFLGYSSTSGQLIISSGGSNDVNFLGGGFKSISTGNFAIGSTTDAGFRLDVNGTARVQSNGTFGITNTRILTIRPEDTSGAYGNSCSIRGGVSNGRLDFYSATNITELRDNIILLTSATGPSVQVGTGSINLNVGGTRLQVAPTTGNVLIGTTTDDGFRLDVNGTARVSDNVLLTNGIIATSGATTRLQGSLNYFTHNRIASSGAHGFQISNYGTVTSFWRWDTGTYDLEIGSPSGALSQNFKLFTAGSERMRLTAGGNVLINTTTDAGYKLDVNGSARFSGNTTINGQLTTTTAFPTIRAYSANTTDSAGFQCATNNGSGNNASFITYAASVGFGLGGNAGFGSGTSIIVFGNSSANSGGTTAIRLRPGGFDTAADALIAYQNSVSIGTTNIPVASAVLDVVSTTQGFLPPRMTQTQRNAIASPAIGLEIYQTDATEGKYIYKSSGWTYIG